MNYTGGKTSLYNTNKFLRILLLQQKGWQMQQHECADPSKTRYSVAWCRYPRSCYQLKCLHYTAIYSLCPYQRKPASLLHMQMQKPNKPVVADLSQYIKNQLPITLLDLILWWDVLWLNMKLPAEGSQYTRLQKF